MGNLYHKEFKRLNLRVERNLVSYDFKADKTKPSSFENNWKNNSIDWIILRDDKAELARFRCQTVANYCFGDYATADTVEYGDTIKAGSFAIKCFVEPRKFHGEIHGIVKATDIDGQVINCNSMQTTANGFQNGRFLIHDRYSFKTGKDTNCAWSAGCIILSSNDLEAFNSILKAYKIQVNEIITGEIVEV